MFKKLRNKFILINLVTTSIILIAAYSAVYLVAKNSADSRKPIPPESSLEITEGSFSDSSGDTTYFRQVVEERVLADRELALENLLRVLIITGISVEILVAIFSFIFAEEAIKPVRDAYETQKIFIANASHEIKTPIAAIKANLEAADLTAENHWIKNIELEADKAERLTLDLLKLAKTDAAATRPAAESVELKPLVSDTLTSFSPRLRQKHLKLTTSYQLDQGATAKLNRADFRELLEILLDNAIKYSATKIRVSVSPKSLTVKNDGATIPKDQLPHIFDRFYQVDKSAAGSGLGLAIAQSLASRNGWKLSAASSRSSTSFTLEF